MRDVVKTEGIILMFSFASSEEDWQPKFSKLRLRLRWRSCRILPRALTHNFAAYPGEISLDLVHLRLFPSGGPGPCEGAADRWRPLC